MSSLKEIVSKNAEILRFLAWGAGLLLVWVILTSFFPKLVFQIHYILIVPQAIVSEWILHMMGYAVKIDFMTLGCQAILVLENGRSVCIGSGCSGLELFLIFAGFLLILRGGTQNKKWFLPLGLLVILLLNIIRITALCMIFYHAPEYMEFNHKYTFVLIVYGAIFLLWWVWINKYSKK